MTTDKQQAINAGAFTLVEKTVPLIRTLLEKQMRAVLEAASEEVTVLHRQLEFAGYDTKRLDFLDAITADELATLREQAETHAMELRAYEATVQNLEQRIRQLEQEVNAHRDNEEAFADELQSVSSVPAGQSVPVVGEPVAWVAYTSEGGFRGITLDVKEADRLAALEFYVITAAELATLREQATELETVALSRCADRIKLSRLEQERDELRKALQKACIGLAHASEANPLYQKNYEACEKALMAIAQEGE